MSTAVPVERVRNIGIIAHIDAGKTTVTERILFYTGITYKIGDVDAGTAVMDWMAQERERGITITAAATTTTWRDHQVNIVDTPGHVDFTVEVERSLRVLDGGIVVFDAVAGVQSQSETVWRQADRYHIPRVCFINKMDRVGADFWKTMQSIRERLNARPIAVQIPMGAEDQFVGCIDLVEMRAFTFPDGEVEHAIGEIPASYLEEAKKRREELIEGIAEVDDQMLISFVEQHEVTALELKKALRRATIAGLVNPVLTGTALKNKGVQPLLDAVLDYLPSPVEVPAVVGHSPKGDEITREPNNDEPFSALAFKVVADPYVGRLVYFRVYSGVAKQGAMVLNSTRDNRERLGRILKMHANRREELTEIEAGQIAATVALKNTFTGDTLCDESKPIVLEAIKFPEPVISVSIEPKTKEDQERMGEVLSRLVEEDPTFHARNDKETGQTIISGMGELHLEIIVDRMLREYSVQATVGRPEVAYKETITASSDSEGKFVRQSGGRGQFGVVKLHVEPNTPAGSGFKFENKLTGGSIPKEYVPAVEHGIKEALETGVLAGYPVIDVKVQLVDGSYHPVDSSELAFKMAGSLGIQAAMKKAGPILKEPIMKVEIAAPDEFFGDVLGDVSSRRGQVIDVDHRGHLRVITAHVPLAETFGYATTLRSISQGRASYTMEFDHYEEVPHSIAEQVSGRLQGATRR
ncbi:MAG: elongation factor G [Dehalococcoidia bacterium]